jgi:hypothetical protein
MLDEDTITTESGFEALFLRSTDLYEKIDQDVLSELLEYLHSNEFRSIQYTAAMKMSEHLTEQIHTPNGLTLTYVGRGLFSLIFTFEYNNTLFAIKAQNLLKTGEIDPNKKSISYIHEVLLFEQLQVDLGDALLAHGIKLPKYYLGGSDVAIREYIEGTPLSIKTAETVVATISPIMQEWLDKKKEKNPRRWEDIRLDLVDILGKPAGKNFILTPSGDIYLIDPFYG